MYREQPGKIGSTKYISYLVRLWRPNGSKDWLASLEAPGTHEHHNFADLASFFAFLQAQTGSEQAIQAPSEGCEARDPPTPTLHMEPP